MKKISVCMATYNGGRYIKLQIESILKQLKEKDELIISDDASTDNTVAIIKDFKDHRIHLIEDCCFRNPVLNFENSLKHACGDYIFLADQDDIWYNDKIKIMSNFLDLYDLVVSDCCLIDSHNKIINDSFFQLRRSGKGLLRNIYKNSYLGCCMGFRKNILEKAIPFPKKVPMHDMWIGIVGEIYGKPLFCTEKLIMYRRHENNVSFGIGKSEFSFLKKLKHRIDLIFLIILLLIRNKN